MHILSNVISSLNQAAKHKSPVANVTNTTLIRYVLATLINLGYITSYSVNRSSSLLTVFLKYTLNGLPAFTSIYVISKPGSRVYCSWRQLRFNFLSKLANNQSTYTVLVLSTSKGIMAHHQAVQQRLGGELLLLIN